jgi:hypothetical protein
MEAVGEQRGDGLMAAPRYWLWLPILLAVSVTGCRRGASTQTSHPPRPLTPVEYQLLNDDRKTRYKSVIVRVPAAWGGALLPFDAGPYRSPVDKAVHGGDLGTLMGLYNQSVFELEHPRVKIEYVNFDMWTDNFRSALAVALAAKRAPAYYIARDLPQTIEQGMYADLTPLMHKWDQFSLQPEGSIRAGTVNGHIYTLAANEMGASVIRYRKDWFREAGIFNEKGEPGPRSDWTWEDFRRIAQKLTDPKRERVGFAHDMSDMLYNQAYGVDLILPDPTGRHTWIFNDRDPALLRSLQAVRDMVTRDRSVSTSVSMGWFERHNEFDAGRAAMIVSFSPHIARESLTAPEKMGRDKPYAETVGMAVPPHGPTGLSELHPETNPVGFDPTLTPEQLEAAFDWCKSWFYGDLFVNRMRSEATEARIKGRRNALYAELLVLPYRPKENLLDQPLEKVFPADYLDVYRAIRAAHAPPLPREFGLGEPPTNEFNRAVRALYSEAITSPDADLKALVAKHAHLIDSNLLDFGGRDDRARLRTYIAARTDFYRRYYPRFYEAEWRARLATYDRIP